MPSTDTFAYDSAGPAGGFRGSCRIENSRQVSNIGPFSSIPGTRYVQQQYVRATRVGSTIDATCCGCRIAALYAYHAAVRDKGVPSLRELVRRRACDASPRYVTRLTSYQYELYHRLYVKPLQFMVLMYTRYQVPGIHFSDLWCFFSPCTLG